MSAHVIRYSKSNVGFCQHFMAIIEIGKVEPAVRWGRSRMPSARVLEPATTLWRWG